MYAPCQHVRPMSDSVRASFKEQQGSREARQQGSGAVRQAQPYVMWPNSRFCPRDSEDARRRRGTTGGGSELKQIFQDSSGARTGL